MQKAEVSFRIGHHFASKLTDYGRGKGLKLHEIPFTEVQRIYAEKANEALPLGEQEYADIISAEYMVFGRKGLGGPQTTEINLASLNISSKLSAEKQHLETLINQETKSKTILLNVFQVFY